MMVTIQLRRDLAANWTSVNPVLSSGEPGFETDTGMFKIGNGSTRWNSLGYENMLGPQGYQGPQGAQGPQGYQGSSGGGGGGILYGGPLDLDMGSSSTVETTYVFRYDLGASV